MRRIKALPYLWNMDFFASYMDRIDALCKAHNVRSLHAFGSAVKGSMGPESDVDLVVDVSTDDPREYGENYFALLFGLEDLLNRPVDLLEHRTLKNKFLVRSIEANKFGLYGS